jgi:lipid II:glycine glycyltransferase (peptidoglycan interpeptide bridge formation enzyme)
MNGQVKSAEFMKWLPSECERQRCNYVEIRPLNAFEPGPEGLQPSNRYCIHSLDLQLPETQLFKRLHKSSVQRKIRRAERERLSYEAGRSEQLQDEFYYLLLITRRRHRLPPQPQKWFRNLLECMGEQAQIRVARRNGAPIAAILTLRHRSTVVFKYGCSDARFHNLGGVALLFWRLIQESKESGAETLDFGRTDLENTGLIAFKNHWGTTRAALTYYRCPADKQGPAFSDWNSRAARRFVSLLPDALFTAVGRILYRHVG